MWEMDSWCGFLRTIHLKTPGKSLFLFADLGQVFDTI